MRTITKIVANPISVRQAFWAPYKNFSLHRRTGGETGCGFCRRFQRNAEFTQSAGCVSATSRHTG